MRIVERVELIVILISMINKVKNVIIGKFLWSNKKYRGKIERFIF